MITAFEGAKPFKITCGSYHSICLSYRLPKIEEPEVSEEASNANQAAAVVQKNQNAAAGAAAAH